MRNFIGTKITGNIFKNVEFDFKYETSFAWRISQRYHHETKGNEFHRNLITKTAGMRSAVKCNLEINIDERNKCGINNFSMCSTLECGVCRML